MTSQISKQAPARALEQVLGLFDTEGSHNEVGNADASWGVFTYHTSFEELWDAPVCQLPCKVAIIWGREAATEDVGEVNVASCISPIAWAVYGLKSRQDLQVLILDTAPSQHRKENRLYRFIEAIQAERMPWLRLVPLSELGRFLTNSWPPLANKETPSANSDSRGEFLDMLSHQIRRDLTESGNEGNHHAIQNIVGPQVLLGEGGREGISFGERALLTLFSTVGLIEESKRAQEAVHSKPEEWPIRYWGKNTIRLLLVDDQHQFGWTAWVESAIHQENKQRVVVASGKKPQFLLEAVRRTLDGRLPDSGGSDAKRDGRFKLEFGNPIEDGMKATATSGDHQTILLLDLRLFALEGNTEAEAEFLQGHLLPLCERFAEEKTSARAFAWPGFSPDELDRVHRWCADKNRERNSPAHLLGLTFLPRLIAVADMSIPIIIFSSTGRREITDLLKPYGNIITDFEKPRFLGRSAHDAVIETRAKFKVAIQRALNLLRAREKCRQVQSAPPCAADIPGKPDDDYCLELFLDETEKKGVSTTVGGCFALFRVGGNADHCASDKADRFDDYLSTQKGIRYFDSRGVGNNPPEGKLLAKGADLSDYLAGCLIVKSAPVCLGAVRLSLSLKNQPSPESALKNVCEADNRFHILLEAIIEVFLCETMVALAGKRRMPSQILVSIYAGTRMLAVEPGDDLQRRTAQSDYGFRGLKTRKKWLLFSLERSGVHRIAARVLDAHQVERNTGRLLALRLPYTLREDGGTKYPTYFVCRNCREIVEGSPGPQRVELVCDCDAPKFRPDYRALHFVADEMLTEFPESGRAGLYDDLFASAVSPGGFAIVPGEFDDSLDEKLQAGLEASRALDCGDLVTAIEKIDPSALSKSGSKPTVRYWIVRRIASRLHELKGADFVRLVSCLAEQRARSEAAEGGSVHA